ncbi:nucleotide exchange factor GrpE [Lutibacter sp.]|uniref:nucleotide exchange factor GrpE n=1 Tax=Lutibacter sp. TaxID=1925666 RepID=UPI00273399AB|nr:nucleotide exchange factor GrpE [Lutibacter sp.]MDP3311910.1 nucleotide exchange factor GrpE [Lutibacter sp.]
MSNKKERKKEKEIIENEENAAEPIEISIEDQLRQELAQEKEKFLRFFAEFENYKKRTSRERIELFSTANKELMSVLLPVLDDFERGLNEMRKTKEEEVLQGMELISNKLKNALLQKGLNIMDVDTGDVFDVEKHEAITQIAAPSEDLKGKIIDVLEQGYKLGDKIIRYPKVVIGQ